MTRRKSKYVGKKFGRWKCVHIGINIATSRYRGINYYYVFERVTHDNKCYKQIRLNSSQACKVYRGLRTVEDYLHSRQANPSSCYITQIYYRFK